MKELTEDVLRGILNIVKDTKDFTLEHAPDYVKQLLSYRYITAYVNLILAVLLIVLPIICAIMIDHIAALVCGFGLPIPGIALAVTCVDEIIKIRVAPKVYIIDHIADLLNPKPKE